MIIRFYRNERKKFQHSPKAGADAVVNGAVVDDTAATAAAILASRVCSC